MAALFTIHGRREGQSAIVVLAGELDIATKPLLREHVETCLNDEAVTAISIDLSALSFIDSSGISALIGCLRLADGTGKSLNAHGAQGRVSNVLTMTGVAAILAGRSPDH